MEIASVFAKKIESCRIWKIEVYIGGEVLGVYLKTF
jgi:hypothetical protein